MLKNLLDWVETQRFRIRPVASLSTTDLEDGKMEYKDGILYIYDNTRGDWVSVQRQTFIFGRSGTTSDQYLNFAGGGISSKSGYRLPRNARAVAMTVQSATSDSYKIYLRKNDTATNLITLTAGGYGASDITINRDLYAGDYLQCYLDYTGVGSGVDNPIVMIELAWSR